MLLGLLAVWLAGGCSGESWQQPSPRAVLELQGGRTLGNMKQPTVSWEAEFQLPAELLGAGSLLLLEDTWWAVDVRLNDQTLGRFESQFGTLRIPVGGTLNAGRNRLWLNVSGPAEEPPLLTGGVEPRPRLDPSPTLLLRPSPALDLAVLPLRNGEVAPVVWVSGPCEGCTVAVDVVRDGRLLQTLGSGGVQGGVATLAPQQWHGPVWRLGAGAQGLVQAVATLRSPQGAALDVANWLTAARDFWLSQGGFLLSGHPSPLLAVRVSPRVPIAEQLDPMAGAGINAVELHGELVRGDWVQVADELGLPLVMLPRCEGRVWHGEDRAEKLALLNTLRQSMAVQDRALLVHLAFHPALLTWVCEGGAEMAGLFCHGAEGDPLARPAGGIDFPVASLFAQATALNTAPWIVEIARDATHRNIREVATAFQQTQAGAALGGVILPPPPQRQDADEWQRTWREVAEGLGAPAFEPGVQRSVSTLVVEGLLPEEGVWLRAPGFPELGATAAPDGTARFSIWYAGTVQVLSSRGVASLDLSPGRWRGLVLEPEVQHLAAAALVP